jgi:hypothetical protein
MAVNPLPTSRFLRELYSALYTYFNMESKKADVTLDGSDLIVTILTGYDKIVHPVPPKGFMGGGTTPSLNGLKFKIKVELIKS